MANGGVDLALVPREDAFEMAKNKELTKRNYLYLGDVKRFNFGERCLGRKNNCKCLSSGIANACQRTNAMGALKSGAVAGRDCKLNLTILLLHHPLNVAHLTSPTLPS